MTELRVTGDELREQYAPVVPWDTFLNLKTRVGLFQWTQGQHVALIGPTGTGKTTLALAILPLRKYIAALATKPKDETLRDFARREHFRIYQSWPEGAANLSPRRMIWPDARKLDADTELRQRDALMETLAVIYAQGNWTVYVDELWFLAVHLRMEHQIRKYLLQARSNGISLVASTQRPSRVPLEIYDQTTHMFFWRDNDETNLRRISGIAYASQKQIMSLVATLGRHQVLYINTESGFMCRTTAPVQKGK